MARWKLPKLNRGWNLNVNIIRLNGVFLIGGLEYLVYFSHHIGNVIIPTDFHSMIFQRGRAKNHQADFQFPRLIDLDGTFKQEMASIKVSPGDWSFRIVAQLRCPQQPCLKRSVKMVIYHYNYKVRPPEDSKVGLVHQRKTVIYEHLWFIYGRY